MSVVEIAELATLPEAHLPNGHVTGPVDGQLLAILWGTAMGLAIADFFAFRVVARGFWGDRVTGLDTRHRAGADRRGGVRGRGLEPAGAVVFRRPVTGDGGRYPRDHPSA